MILIRNSHVNGVVNWCPLNSKTRSFATDYLKSKAPSNLVKVHV
jgi:hypothetical protein